MLEHLAHHAPHYILSVVGLILAALLRRATKKFDHISEAVVKANLAFDEVADRKPEYRRLYEAWKRNGALITPAAKARAGR